MIGVSPRHCLTMGNLTIVLTTWLLTGSGSAHFLLGDRRMIEVWVRSACRLQVEGRLCFKVYNTCQTLGGVWSPSRNWERADVKVTLINESFTLWRGQLVMIRGGHGTWRNFLHVLDIRDQSLVVSPFPLFCTHPRRVQFAVEQEVIEIETRLAVQFSSRCKGRVD